MDANRDGAPDHKEHGMSRVERGPVPDDRPAPPCMAMLPAAVVLTVVAVAANWLGMPRRQFARAVALGVVATGLMSVLAGAGWTLWLYDLTVPATTGALLVLYLVSTLATGDGARRRSAAVVCGGSPRAARHRRHPDLGALPVPIHTSAVLVIATAGGAPMHGGVR
jgi:hypothetical protein